MTAKTQKARRCLCGCNSEVGKRATFVPGHDSKLHSRWLQVRRGESKEKLTREQAEYGDSHWEVTERKPKPKAKAAKGKVKGKAKRGAKRAANTKSPATVAAEQLDDEDGE